MILVNRFKSKMTAKYLDYDRFCNDSGIYKKYISVLKMTEHKLTICVRLMW